MQITQQDLIMLCSPLWDKHGKTYRKYRHIYATVAQGAERIETITADGSETFNTANAGDYIVANQTEAGERYIVPKAKFEARYKLVEQTKTIGVYEAVARIKAIKLTSTLLKKLALPNTFHFTAPWGEAMIAKKGDYLAQPVGASEPEVYRIAEKEFKETYVLNDE